MLRMESETGWWLITHPDHAHLAGDFAAAWGNAQFRKPEPRARVLKGIACHDDGWAARDAHPTITRQGKPSAFSTELVGKYSAFEEIDLEEYLAVRDRAVRIIAEEDPTPACSSPCTLTICSPRMPTARPLRPRAWCFSMHFSIANADIRKSCARPSLAMPRLLKLKQRANDPGTLPPLAGLRQSFAADLRRLFLAGSSAASAATQQRRNRGSEGVSHCAAPFPPCAVAVCDPN
jgi:hypothetical protein